MPAQHVEAARAARANAKSASTRTAYAVDWADFEAYCVRCGVPALPADPAIVASYVAALLTERGLKLSTVRRRLVAISQRHKAAALPTPTANEELREILKGFARDDAVQRQSRRTKKTALTSDLLKDALLAIGDGTLRRLRDRALLLLGFAGALRRSELVALNLDDLEFSKDGLVVRIRRSKTNQEGRPEAVDVPIVPNRALCPVRALRAWLDAADVTTGAVFRSFSLAGELQPRRLSSIDVARAIKRATKLAHLKGDFSGHSLRRGYITTGIRKGVMPPILMRRSRHRSLAVFNEYIEEAEMFVDNPLVRMLE